MSIDEMKEQALAEDIKNEDELFVSWKKAHCDEKDTSYLNSNIPKAMFLPDGIIEKEKFKEKNPKILFIAKEVNWF